jgi:hypothetical protein
MSVVGLVYPIALYDDLLKLVGAGSHMLEAGAGTGHPYRTDLFTLRRTDPARATDSRG